MAELDMLAEHQAPAKSQTTGGVYDPSPEEQQALKLGEYCFKEAKREKSKTDSDWLKWYKMYRGRQWFQQRPSYRHSEVINLIFPAINSQAPLLTDSRPRFNYLPQEPSDREFADIMNEVAQSDWEKYNWLYQLFETILDGYFYGTGLSNLDYEPELNYGEGAACFKSFDPFLFFPDPDARDINDPSCRYVVTAVPTAVEKVREEHKDKAEYIQADITEFYGYDKTNIKEERTGQAADNQTYNTESGNEQLSDRKMTLVVTVWLKSNEYIEEKIKEMEESGREKEKYVQRLKYPRGRKIKYCGGGPNSRVLLEDGENPNEDGKFPFARYVNSVNPRQLWGISEIEQLASPQMIFNKLISFALDTLTLMGNPIWVVDSTSGIDPWSLENRPGGVIVKNPDTTVQRQEGVQLQPYVLQMIDRIKTWFDDIMGTADITRGVADQVTAAKAIDSLMDAAQTRVRAKSRNLDAMLQDIGQLYQARVLQYYSAPRVFRLTNNDQSQKYFKFHVEPSEEPVTNEVGEPINDPQGQPLTKKVYKGVRVEYADDGFGRQVENPDSRKVITLSGTLDTRVITGTTLPFAKADKENQAYKLFEMGIIPEEEVLDAIDYPNKEKIKEWLTQKREAESQAAQMKGATG